MSSTYTPTGSNYLDARYQLIAAAERSINSWDIYPRDVGDGQITIGAGINITSGDKSNKFAVYRALGIVIRIDGTFDTTIGTAVQRGIESGYVTRLNEALRNTSLSLSDRIAQLHQIMIERAADSRLDGYAVSRNPYFAFEPGATGERQIRQSFDEAANSYENNLRNKLGSAIYDATSFANSKEHVLLFSRMWLGGGISVALKESLAPATFNRAEAWFQFRYGWSESSETDPTRNPNRGWAKRHYMESAVFGLYEQSPSNPLAEAKGIYRMLRSHRDVIMQRENKYSGIVAAANSDYAAVLAATGSEQVQTLTTSLNRACTAILDDVATSTNSDTKTAYQRWSADNRASFVSTNLYFGAGAGAEIDARPYESVTLNNDILIVEDGVLPRDYTLHGGSGNDLLIGGNGNDNLYGGTGNDFMAGGAGDDKYFIYTGDGNDVIEDKQGTNTIYLNDRVLGTFYRDATHTSYTSADGTFTASFSGGDFIVYDTRNGQTITLNQNFQEGDFGITFQDAPAAIQPTYTVTGDPQIHSASGIAPGSEPSNWHVTNTYGHVYDAGMQLVSYSADYFLVDGNGNPTETGGPARDDLLNGTTANDHLMGMGGNDILDATTGGGNDILDGGAGQDDLEAGAGNDILIGGTDTDLLKGGAGNDRLYGTVEIATDQAIANGNTDTPTGLRGDWMNGGSGDDTIVGGSGNDVLMGGGGKDLLIAGAGDDAIYGDVDMLFITATRGANQTSPGYNWNVMPNGELIIDTNIMGEAQPADAAADVIYAGAGKDHAYGGAGDDVIYGEDGNDNLFGNDGNDMLFGGAGDDNLYGDMPVVIGGTVVEGNDYLDGGDGNDTLWGNGGDDTLIGGAGDDKLYGGDGANYLDGGDGNDDLGSNGDGSTLFGGAGDDRLYAGGKNSYLDGEEGNNQLAAVGGSNELFAGAGNDTLWADGGSNYLDAGDGTNKLDAYGGNNELNAGAGNDALTATGGSNYLDGGDGDNTLFASGGSNELFAGAGNDTLTATGGGNYLDAGDGSNTLVATGGNNTLYAGAGNDYLVADGGGNYLDAGDGNDILKASGGNNTLVGGSGSDTYLLNLGDGQDTIMDSPDLAGNVIVFGAGITAGNTQFLQQGADLLIQYGTLSDTALIQNFAPNGAAGGQTIAQFRFADGSQGAYTTDGLGNAGMQALDASGRVVADFWQAQNGEYGNHTYTYDAQGIKIRNDWTKSDGSHGFDVYSPNGSSSGSSFFVNGTSSTYTDDGLGNTMETSYRDYSQLIKTGDKWTKADGSYGSDLFNSDGSGSGNTHLADGSYSEYVKYASGDMHLISVDAAGSRSDTWTYADGNYGIVTDDGQGNVTTTIYSAQGAKLGDSWSRADGTFGNDNFNGDGSSSGAIHQVDGSYSEYTNDGLGQVITKNYNSNNDLTGSNTTETNGLHNVVSSYENPAGVKLRETWIHSDGSSGTDLVSATDYSGFLNIAASGTKRTDTWHPGQVFEAWYTVDLRYGDSVNAGSYSWRSDGSGRYDQGSVYIWGDSWDSYAFSGVAIYDYTTGVEFVVSINSDGSSQISGATSGYRGTLYAGPAQTPVTVTLHGHNIYNNPYGTLNGLYSTLKLDGQGNGVVVDYTANGIKLSDMWFHNDGINGMDKFNADGSSSGFSTNLDGSYTAYTDDGHGHVVVMDTPPVPPVITPPPPDTTSPPQPPAGSSPGTGNTKPTYYFVTSPDGQGGSYVSQIWSNGTVYVAHLDANGNILSGGFAQTDPGYGADTTVDGNKSGWTYDVAGVPTSSYSADGLGNVTTCFYDAQGRISRSSVATTASQGNVTTSFYDAAGNLTGTGTKVTTTTANGLVQETATTYDVAGQLTGSTVVVSDGQSNSTTYNYDAAGVLLSLSTQTVTSTGAVELAFYDSNKMPTSIILTDSDSQGVISTHNYDGNGKLISSVIATPDNAGNVTTCNYDATGALTGYVTLTSNSQHDTIITTYDANGFKILDNVLQAGGVEISTEYHLDGARVRTTYKLDHSYSITTNDGLGNVTTSDYSAQEVKLQDTWSRADGRSGTDTFNADGSVSGTITYADGTSGVILNDGHGRFTTTHYGTDGITVTGTSITTNVQGNSRTISYDANGVEINESWINTNGTSGGNSFNPDGSKASDRWSKLDGSFGSDIFNADGSYSSTVSDGHGTTSTTNYDASGAKLNDSWARLDGTSGSDIFNADGSHSSTVNDGHGTATTTAYDTSGAKLNDSWTKTDGSYGNDTFNADGSSSGTSHNANGSYSSHTNDGQGNITTTDYDANGNMLGYSMSTSDAQGNVTTVNYDAVGNALGYHMSTSDGTGGTTTTNFDTAGRKLSDSWTKADGTWGSDTFNADGSGSGTSYNPDGSYSSTYTYTTGNGYTNFYDRHGQLVGDTWTGWDGSYGSDTFNADGTGSGDWYNADGSYSTYTYANNWNVYEQLDYGASGVKVGDYWNSADGSWGSDTFNADGSSSGTIHNADGSYSDYINDGHGTLHTLNYDAVGTLLGDSWSQVNIAPSATADTVTVDEDTAQTIIAAADLLANDTDANVGDTLRLSSFDAVSANGNTVTRDSNGNLVFDIGNRYQYLAEGQTVTDSFTYTVTDSAGAASIATVTMTISGTNDAPVTTVDTAAVQEELSIAAMGNVLANDTDVDQSTVLQVANAGVFAGQFGQLTLNADGSYAYALDNASLAVQSLADGQVVTETFSYHATDGITSTPSTLTVTITGTNDAPVVAADTAAVQEDLSITATGNVLSNDSDVDQGTVLAVANAGVFAGQFGQLTLNADGNYTYALDNASLGVQSLAEGQVVTETFAYRATDGLVSTPSTLTVTITGTNDVPVTTVDTAAVQEDLSISASGNVLANDSDIDQGTVLTVANAGVFAGQYGQLTLNVDGSYAYALDNASLGVQSLAEGQVVTETFAYQATDGLVSTPSVLTVTIIGTNDAPVTTVDTAAVQEDLSIAAIGNVLANDGDVDQGTMLTVANAGVFAGQYGQLTLNADGSYTYALDNASLAVQSLAEGQVVTETFAYQATDGLVSTPSTLTVTITGTNDAPVTTVDTAAVQEDLSITATGNVLTNDSDIDQGTVLKVANAGTFTGNYGSLVLNADGSYTYALDNSSLAVQSLAEGQTVTETFSYQATDGLVSTPSTLTVTITGTNDAPVVVADTAAVQEDLSISASGNVLANDTDVDQGTVLQVANAGVFVGQYGTLTLDANGSYTYALDNASLGVQSLAEGQVVTETFAYQATDGITSTPSTLTVTITGTNDAPIVAVPLQDASTLEDQPFQFQVPADTFTDIDQGDVLTYHATLADGSALPDWLKFDAATLTLSGVPSNWDVAMLKVAVTATDKLGLSATSVFKLDVQNVNDAPMVANHLADQHLDEGKRFSIAVPANTFDDWDIVHGDSLRYTATLANGKALPKWLTFDAATRTFSGKAKGDGNLDILLTATDQAGASVSQVFNLSTGHDHHQEHHDDHHGHCHDDALPADTSQDEIITSSTVNDIIHTGNGADTIVFQRGDGQDTLYGGIGTDNTVVLGGGIRMSDIALTKQGNDLILETGPSTSSGQAGDQITLRNWYDSTVNNKSVLNLTLITDAVAEFERKGHHECETRIDQFDFTAVVNAFDQACGTSATYQHWNAANSLMAAHLEDSDDSALGSSAFQDVNIGSLIAAGQSATQTLNTAQLNEQSLLQRQVCGV